MKAIQRIELLKDLVQQAVDRGATSVEAIHQQIAGLPFEMLEKSGLLDDDKLRLREKQQRTIGTVYDAIRRINRQVGELISDQFELVEDSAHIKKVLDEKEAEKVAPKGRKTAPKAKRALAKKPVTAKNTRTSKS